MKSYHSQGPNTIFLNRYKIQWNSRLLYELLKAYWKFNHQSFVKGTAEVHPIFMISVQ
jgi:hypothetical protein